MITVILYGWEDCHLCDEVLELLDSLQARFPHQVSQIDIDQDQRLVEKYGVEIPVLEIGPFVLKYPISPQELEITFSTMVESNNPVANQPKSKVSGDRLTRWFARLYPWILSGMALIYVGLPFLAPVFMKVGIETPAKIIYRVYGITCHQLAYRSIFLFGEQNFYPSESAKVQGLSTYRDVTQFGESGNTQDVLTARQFIGNPIIGYKVALCQRDVAIYGGIVIFGIIFAMTRRWWRPLHWLVWIGIGILPIALDGVSQLFSQSPYDFWSIRESTPFLRILTGFLFGFMTAWFGFPILEESMRDFNLDSRKQRKSQKP